MNNAPLTLILIAAFGLIVVLSLGVFFAVKPRTKSARFFYYGLPPGQSSSPPPDATTAATLKALQNALPPAPVSTGNSYPGLKSLNYNVENGQLRKSVDPYQKPPPPVSPVRSPDIHTDDAAPPLIRFHSLPRETTSTPILTPAPIVKEEQFWSAENRMPYSKVVGLGFHSGSLFVPSHDAGKISLLSTPDLKPQRELSCPKCRIYDVAALPTGELIVAQGKRRKLSKLSVSEDRLVKEIHLEYATKGVAVSPATGHIYLLTRAHDRVHVYDSDLENAGVVYLPNDNRDDCNFLTVDSRNRLIVSCESEVFLMDASNAEFLSSIHAPNGTSYSMGIALDSHDNIYLAQRGRALVDVFSPNGKLLRSIGRPQETLWSDIALGTTHLYAVDYIGAKILAMPLQS